MKTQKGRKPGIHFFFFFFNQKGIGFAFSTLEQYFKYLHSVKGKVQAQFQEYVPHAATC